MALAVPGCVPVLEGREYQSMNSKRDYEAMAKILRDLRRDDGTRLADVVNEVLQAVAYRYADVAVTRNQLFDRQRFYRAAGIE